jgi:hypothetical protein
VAEVEAEPAKPRRPRARRAPAAKVVDEPLEQVETRNGE